ncbi:MAG: hypothetical protein WBB37_02785 [bacterium]
MRKSWWVFLALLIITCAHKAPPLVKDRMKPKLQNIIALNNIQVQFTFSEDIDTLNLSTENFRITTGEDTLRIKTLYPSLSAAEIVAITELQMDTEYSVNGYVYDTAQNKGAFIDRFAGTSRPDTIAPWIIKYSEGKNKSEFYFQFSEAMDTTFFEFSLIPKKNIITQWRNLRVCYLVPVDTIDAFAFDTTYYIYINQGCRDLSGNLFGTLVTNITPDTTFISFILKGSVHINDTLVKTGFALLKRQTPLGIALIEGGDFQFEVRDSLPYTVEVLSGKYSGSGLVSTTDSLNIIDLKLDEKDFDNIFN